MTGGDRESLCDALLPMPLAPHTRGSAARRFLSVWTLSLFLFSILWVGVRGATRHPTPTGVYVAEEQLALGVDDQAASSKPDFSQYVELATLSKHELRSKGGRVIFVGDIHGMRQPLQQLLKKVDFNATHDTLVHAGDIITKGPHSRQVLQKLILVKALGVRGNQDQKVVEWRGWIEWVAGRNGGKEWLHKMEKRAETTKKLTKTDYKHFRQEAAAKGWKIPAGWEFGSRVYRLARHLKKEEYQYLLDLPTALHIPSLHTVVVHAGILPMDPRRRILSPKQPLSHPPKVKHNKTEPVLRNLQELALLSDIPQNKDPWVKLNMRSVLNDGSISRYKDGAPWTELWHKVIKLCDGFDSNLQLATDNITSELAPKQNWKEWIDEDFKGIQSLPCKDVTVVYGHAASRGLDIKRWSKGLDTGCVYNLRLTALVIGKRWRPDSGTDAMHFVDTEDVLETDEEIEGEIISFGRKGKGKIVQVPCAGGKPRR